MVEVPDFVEPPNCQGKGFCKLLGNCQKALVTEQERQYAAEDEFKPRGPGEGMNGFEAQRQSTICDAAK